jgi:hypothetical protein
MNYPNYDLEYSLDDYSRMRQLIQDHPESVLINKIQRQAYLSQSRLHKFGVTALCNAAFLFRTALESKAADDQEMAGIRCDDLVEELLLELEGTDLDYEIVNFLLLDRPGRIDSVKHRIERWFKNQECCRSKACADSR